MVQERNSENPQKGGGIHLSLAWVNIFFVLYIIIFFSDSFYFYCLTNSYSDLIKTPATALISFFFHPQNRGNE